MNTNFKITALENTFNHLFDLEDDVLAEMGSIKMIADTNPGFPCRVSLQDAEIGEEVILLPLKHHDTLSPYQASGPLFVRKNAQRAELSTNEIPKMLRHRLLSIRAYNSNGMMLNANTIKGEIIENAIQDMFSNPLIAYLHVHNSGPGCYNCQVNRVA